MISIAMATYNGGKFLREQLDSILLQTVQDFELVVCDDCSIDNTWGILEEYAQKDIRIRIIKNEHNLGVWKNFEKSISLTKGEFIALCDQDDIWTKNHLEKLIENIGDKMLAVGNALMIKANGESMHMLLNYQEALDYVPMSDLKKAYSIIYFRSPYQGACMLIKRDFLKYAMPIPPSVSHDSWFSHLACFYGGINYIDAPLLRYRRHDNNVTGNKIFRRSKWITFVKHLIFKNSLPDRPYIMNVIQSRVHGLTNDQQGFISNVINYHSRKKKIHGRLLNMLFEIKHYRLIYSCDKFHWL